MFSFINSFISKFKSLLSSPDNPNHSYSNSYTKEKGRKKAKFLMDKGEYLERSIFDIVDKIIGYGPKKILVDLDIKKVNTGSNQIDLVVLHKTGIYVIEAKNLSGYIFGDNDHLNWIQKLGKNNTYKFYNPIKQNTSHINQVKRVLEIQNTDTIVSLIVFGNRCTVNYRGDLDSLNFTTSIITLDKLKRCIKGHFSSRESIFSENEIFDMYDKLSTYARSDSSVKSEHIEYVKKMQKRIKTK